MKGNEFSEKWRFFQICITCHSVESKKNSKRVNSPNFHVLIILNTDIEVCYIRPWRVIFLFHTHYRATRSIIIIECLKCSCITMHWQGLFPKFLLGVWIIQRKVVQNFLHLSSVLFLYDTLICWTSAKYAVFMILELVRERCQKIKTSLHIMITEYLMK